VASSVGAVLLILLGAARGFGGLVLLLPAGAEIRAAAASPGRLTMLGLGLVVVACLCIGSGVSVMRRRPVGVPLGLVALAAFVVGGAANGVALYGALQPAGLAVNLIVAAVIAALLLVGKRSRQP